MSNEVERLAEEREWLRTDPLTGEELAAKYAAAGSGRPARCAGDSSTKGSGRRHEWYEATRGRVREPHPTAVVTYHASPVRSRTVKACLTCLWIAGDLDTEHGSPRSLAGP